MHTDWECYALIMFEGDGAGVSPEILTYRSYRDPIAKGAPRLPGGTREERDADPMRTLVRLVREQTGIDLGRKNSLTCVEHFDTRVKRPPNGKRTKKFTRSVRYYRVTLSMDGYLDRPGFALRDDEHAEWRTVASIASDRLFYLPHPTVLSGLQGT